MSKFYEATTREGEEFADRLGEMRPAERLRAIHALVKRHPEAFATSAKYPTPAASFQTQVQGELESLRIKDAARRQFAAEQQPPPKPWDMGTLADMLERPEEPPGRVIDLVPWGASTLLVAQHKTGKTTFLLNLARSLLTGEPFLGEFAVTPVAEGRKVAVLNFEVSGRQFAKWADEVGVPRDRLWVVNLRGMPNPFADPERLADLGEALRAQNVETVFVDPFGRAYPGDNQNDNGPVGLWLTALDAWVRSEVGAEDVVLAAHTGWDGERVRGASALPDWPDSVITLTKDDQGVRYMSAFGRDVDISEDALSFDPDTRRLTKAGTGSRKVANEANTIEELLPRVLDVVKARPGIRSGQVEQELKDRHVSFRRGDPNKALNLGEQTFRLRYEDGHRNAKHWFLTDGKEGIS